MTSWPSPAGGRHDPTTRGPPHVQVLALHLTSPTYQRVATLLVGAVLTTGRRTVANLLRTLRHLAPGHPADYRRVLSRAPWSGSALGCALVRLLLGHVLPAGPVHLVGDDTVGGHPGRTAYGKARHRDPVRSSDAYTAWRHGHTWVGLAVLVRLPFAARRWALPALVDLYRSPERDRVEGRPHKTPAQLVCRLLRLLLTRFPGRAFVFAGDSGYGTHEAARFCHRHRARLTLVSKPCPDANLFAPPPPYRGTGRPRAKGPRVPKPRQAAATAPRTAVTVVWYGGGTRRVEAATGAGHGCKGGCRLVPVRWVFVEGATGTHRGEYLFTTDPALTADAVVGTYCGRWSIEIYQADCTSRRGWVCGGRIGYHRREGVARAGRVVPATSGRPHRRSRMPDTTRRRPTPPRA